MAAHTEEQFEIFMSQLRKTNQTLDYFFCDFKKIKSNVDRIKVNLNLLNSLLTSSNIQSTIDCIFEEYGTKPFEVLDILIAVRDSKDGVWVVEKSPLDEPQKLSNMFKSPNGVYTFLKTTGLLNLFQNKDLTNLVDYVFGIETGMDTNARKNRSGQIMENEISSILRSNGIPFKSQVKSITFPDLKDKLGKDVKKFDFSIRTTRKTYLLEVNFYNGGGSKPNEVARAYTGIAPKINSNPKYEFVWITDGQGWFDAKPEIKAAYDVIPSIYNLTSLPNFLKKIKDEGFVTDSLF